MLIGGVCSGTPVPKYSLLTQAIQRPLLLHARVAARHLNRHDCSTQMNANLMAQQAHVLTQLAVADPQFTSVLGAVDRPNRRPPSSGPANRSESSLAWPKPGTPTRSPATYRCHRVQIAMGYSDIRRLGGGQPQPTEPGLRTVFRGDRRERSATGSVAVCCVGWQPVLTRQAGSSRRRRLTGERRQRRIGVQRAGRGGSCRWRLGRRGAPAHACSLPARSLVWLQPRRQAAVKPRRRRRGRGT